MQEDEYKRLIELTNRALEESTKNQEKINARCEMFEACSFVDKANLMLNELTKCILINRSHNFEKKFLICEDETKFKVVVANNILRIRRYRQQYTHVFRAFEHKSIYGRREEETSTVIDYVHEICDGDFKKLIKEIRSLVPDNQRNWESMLNSRKWSASITLPSKNNGLISFRDTKFVVSVDSAHMYDQETNHRLYLSWVNNDPDFMYAYEPAVKEIFKLLDKAETTKKDLIQETKKYEEQVGALIEKHGFSKEIISAKI